MLCLRRRKFVLTTDSNHPLAVYPNLAREIVLSGLGQLWVTDITYIRLRWEFVYLAVILDAHSRRVVGWALEDTLEGKLTIAGCGWRCSGGGQQRSWCITPAAASSMPPTATSTY